LVSNLISGVGGRTMGSRLENLHLNSFIIGSVCFLDKFLSMPCVIGKSMLMRKSDLEAIGGFQTVKDVLAEDYIIGKKMHKRGKKVILSNHIIKNVNEYWSIKKFINRHTRWGRLRWKIGGIRYISELISNPVFMSFILLLLWEVSKMTVYFLLFVSLLKIIGDYYLGKMIGSCIRGQGSTDRREEKYLDPLSLTFGPLYYLLSPVKDIIIGLIWFVPILSNTVVWRGNRYVIGKDSVLSPYPESRIWAWRYRIVDTIKARFA
ncbi:MAG: glycosyltransferase family 2 protein, partial [Thermodesulfovibrionales bacterium]